MCGVFKCTNICKTFNQNESEDIWIVSIYVLRSKRYYYFLKLYLLDCLTLGL